MAAATTKERPRLRLLKLDRQEHPRRALIATKFGVVRVRWKRRNPDRVVCEGSIRAIDRALAAIEHIALMCESLR